MIKSHLKKIIFLLLAASTLIISTSQAHAQEDTKLQSCESIGASSTSEPQFYVTKVSGLIDPIVQTHLIKELTRAETENGVGFIIWMNSNGSTLSQEDFEELSQRLANTKLDTGIWVGSSAGNSGRSEAIARGGAAELSVYVDKLALTPGTKFGKTKELYNPSNFNAKYGEYASQLETEYFDAQQAIDLEISEGPLEQVADIKQFLASFDSYKTSECLTQAGIEVRKSITPTRLSGLSMASQLFHTAASPQVAYLFFVLGLALIVFEFFTAGVGVAGVTGAGFFLLGSYGLWVLPTRPWAVILILLAMFFISIDIQTNLPRLYSAAGLILFSIGSIFLYSGMSASILTLTISIASAAVYIYSAMPAMVRSRFSTPTIGRKWMIGSIGTARTDINPEGEILINNSPWKAIANRATPISEGEDVKVVAINRLMLEVEPVVGAAKDYRK